MDSHQESPFSEELVSVSPGDPEDTQSGQARFVMCSFQTGQNDWHQSTFIIAT